MRAVVIDDEVFVSLEGVAEAVGSLALASGVDGMVVRLLTAAAGAEAEAARAVAGHAPRGDADMTRADAVALLHREQIGVVAAPGVAGRPPFAVPVRHVVQPDGAIRLDAVSSATAARLLGAGGGATLCVHEAQPPHRYVAVDGSVVVAPGGASGPLVTLVPSGWFGAYLDTAATALSPAGSTEHP